MSESRQDALAADFRGKTTLRVALIGVATLHPGDDWRAWMKRSDDKLYVAKSGGRDRVVV